MPAYFDTACLVKCYVREDGTDATLSAATSLGRIHCSTFGRVELASGLRRARRENRISAHTLNVIMLQVADDVRRSTFEWIPVSTQIVEGARAQMSELPTAVVLRAGDAIHLATARLAGFGEIWSTDKRLLAAAAHFGLEGRDPTE